MRNLNFNLNGVKVNTSFQFNFELINVVNKNDPEDLWADADYVKLASPIASQILDFNGMKYQFQLEFGESTAAGLTHFDEFHVLENERASTRVYGTLVEVGTISFNN